MGKIPRKTFETVYKSLALPLTKFIVKRTGGDEEAVEEVLERTMVAAWKGWNTFQHKSNYFTWICRIALNKISDYYREEIHRNSRIIGPLLDEIANYDTRQMSPEEWYSLNELCNAVKDSIKILPEEKQRLLFMRYWKGLAIKKIAKELNISERAVEGKIYRSKQRLKEIVLDKHPEISISCATKN